MTVPKQFVAQTNGAGAGIPSSVAAQNAALEELGVNEETEFTDELIDRLEELGVGCTDFQSFQMNMMMRAKKGAFGTAQNRRVPWEASWSASRFAAIIERYGHLGNIEIGVKRLSPSQVDFGTFGIHQLRSDQTPNDQAPGWGDVVGKVRRDFWMGDVEKYGIAIMTGSKWRGAAEIQTEASAERKAEIEARVARMREETNAMQQGHRPGPPVPGQPVYPPQYQHPAPQYAFAPPAILPHAPAAAPPPNGDAPPGWVRAMDGRFIQLKSDEDPNTWPPGFIKTADGKWLPWPAPPTAAAPAAAPAAPAGTDPVLLEILRSNALLQARLEMMEQQRLAPQAPAAPAAPPQQPATMASALQPIRDLALASQSIRTEISPLLGLVDARQASDQQRLAVEAATKAAEAAKALVEGTEVPAAPRGHRILTVDTGMGQKWVGFQHEETGEIDMSLNKTWQMNLPTMLGGVKMALDYGVEKLSEKKAEETKAIDRERQLLALDRERVELQERKAAADVKMAQAAALQEGIRNGTVRIKSEIAAEELTREMAKEPDPPPPAPPPPEPVREEPKAERPRVQVNPLNGF